jgi:hypothetical protein
MRFNPAVGGVTDVMSRGEFFRDLAQQFLRRIHWGASRENFINNASPPDKTSKRIVNL